MYDFGFFLCAFVGYCNYLFSISWKVQAMMNKENIIMQLRKMCTVVHICNVIKC